MNADLFAIATGEEAEALARDAAPELLDALRATLQILELIAAEKTGLQHANVKTMTGRWVHVTETICAAERAIRAATESKPAAKGAP